MEGGFDTGRILDGFPVPCNSPLQVDPRLFSERRFTQNHTVKMLFRVGTGTLDNFFRLAFPFGSGQLAGAGEWANFLPQIPPLLLALDIYPPPNYIPVTTLFDITVLTRST